MRMEKHKTAKRLPARQRLLDAAARVFARDGLEGATTRAIAREAGVNEVTLFRQFQNKENLIGAVVGSAFGLQAARPQPALPDPTGDLRQDLMNYARFYEAVLAENLLLIRTMIGEIHRHRDHERQVLEGIFRPLRAELINRLSSARRDGRIRPDVDSAVAADLLSGMIFTGVIRRCSLRKPLEYAPEHYLTSCVEVLARGIEQFPRSKRA
ncbi:MAG: transcriptional regulator, TetR family [Pedosphaera sp.]|nr:transcriptional regulator, TetR family [Pedosphaera sp.]